jgi:hypothetical protein
MRAPPEFHSRSHRNPPFHRSIEDTAMKPNALSAAILSFAAAETMPARYQVSFERTWSSKTHPKDFPLLAHFSPVIGATHNADYSPFREGTAATPGLEHLCEEGKHQPLGEEIRAAIAAGTAGAMIETPDPIRSVPGKASAIRQ